MSEDLGRALEKLHSGEERLHEAEKLEQEAIHEIEEATHEIENAEKHGVIHFTLDGEPCTTDRRELTPNEIIREFGHRDPSITYLVQIFGGQKESYQGKGEIPIKMHDGMRFQIISVGPMSVSYAERS